MIITYDMSTSTFETVSGNSTVENTTPDYIASELHDQSMELQLLCNSSEVVSETSTLTPELAAMDSETFLHTMKK